MPAGDLPDSVGTQRYRKLLNLGWIGAIAGLTVALRELFGLMMDAGFHAARLDWRSATFYVILFFGWCMVGRMAHLGLRRNVRAPDWMFVVLVLLIWAGIVVRKIG